MKLINHSDANDVQASMDDAGPQNDHTTSLLSDAERARLVDSHMGLVVSIARRYAYRGIDLTEVVCEGNAALVRAVNRFDPSRGVAFATYAIPWIQHAVRSACAQSRELIALPPPIRKLTYAYRRMQATQQPGDLLSNRDVAERLGISREKAALITEASNRRRLAPTRRENTTEYDVLETISSTSDADPASRIEARDQIVQLRTALATLSASDRELIILYFGLDNEPPLRADAIARRLSLPLVRVVAGLKRVVDQLHQTMSVRQVA